MPDLENTALLAKDRKLLQETQIPIVTVSASFRDDLAKFHHVNQYFGDKQDEVVFSRAHYSMAVAAAVGAWKNDVRPQKAWLVDPTNYVRRQDWSKIEFTEEVGKAMARHKLLKIMKDFIDTKVRNKLPITDAITTPLLYLFEHVHRPILSFHYEAGNILAGVGKHIVQVVTDPHVRDQYIEFAQLPTMRFCVFDDNTKIAFLEKAHLFGKEVDPKRIVVTGPPVDPRIVAIGKKKKPEHIHHRPLHLALITGGLGTNKSEIEEALYSLIPSLRKKTLQLIIYVGVHEDIRERMHTICNQEGIATAAINETDAPVRIMYSPHIVEANESLIQYVFPWADGLVTKPSGDMAYDGAAAGCFLLTLEPWGEWEQNIRDVFEQKEISRRAIPKELEEQLEALQVKVSGKSWMERAMQNAQELPSLFTHGIENILAQMPKS